ncbi:MAG: hypothetical protein ACTHLE_10135 [Agriterribacter sp.]
MKALPTDTIELSDEDLKETSIHGNFSERSEVSQEIISRKPDFYERWALLIFLIILLILTTSTWFIKYPDIVQASAILKGSNAPKEIIPRETGKLAVLFVKNNQQVKQGDILGWVESNADAREVIDLATRLDSSMEIAGRGEPKNIAALFKRRFSRLGELQTAYQIFITALLQYNDYLVNGFYANKKSMLLNDIAALQNMQRIAVAQRKLTVEDNALAQKTFEMNKKLFEQNAITAEEYRQAQSILLNKQLSVPQADANIISQQSQIRDKQKEIDQLTHDILQQQLTFEQSLQTLKSNVEEWLKQYTLRSPADGMVVFTSPLEQNQFIEQGRLLGYVNPLDSKYYAEIKLQQNNLEK